MAKKTGRKSNQALGPWRVDGISAAAASAAAEAAECARVPLSAWLSRVIREAAARERHERERHRGSS
jgi:hypothetical protein